MLSSLDDISSMFMVPANASYFLLHSSSSMMWYIMQECQRYILEPTRYFPTYSARDKELDFDERHTVYSYKVRATNQIESTLQL